MPYEDTVNASRGNCRTHSRGIVHACNQNELHATIFPRTLREKYPLWLHPCCAYKLFARVDNRSHGEHLYLAVWKYIEPHLTIDNCKTLRSNATHAFRALPKQKFPETLREYLAVLR
jgi:hypothetical protein